MAPKSSSHKKKRSRPEGDHPAAPPENLLEKVREELPAPDEETPGWPAPGVLHEALRQVAGLPPADPPASILAAPTPSQGAPSLPSKLVLDWIAPDLRSLARPVEGLQEDPENARRHGPVNLDSIRASLEAHGQRKPIVVKDGIVIAGNGTLSVARSLGWTHLACTEYDGPEVLARAYAIADNRTAELAEWDPDALLRSLKAADGAGLLSATGYMEDECRALLAALDEGDPLEGLTGDASATPDEDFVRFSFGSHAAMIAREVYERFTAKIQDARKDSPETLIDDVFRELLDASESPIAHQE